jgi:hypothetical protein
VIQFRILEITQDPTMPDQDSYLKRATDKVAAIASAARAKANDIAASLTKVASGNDGSLGAAKGAISGRQKQIDDATDAALNDGVEKRANGGMIRGGRGYSKRG